MAESVADNCKHLPAVPVKEAVLFMILPALFHPEHRMADNVC